MNDKLQEIKQKLKNMGKRIVKLVLPFILIVVIRVSRVIFIISWYSINASSEDVGKCNKQKVKLLLKVENK